MFTQPVMPAPPPGPPPAPPTSSRPSRLRGLSYLRTYTQNHLLSRDHNSSSNNSSNNNSGASTGGSGIAASLTRSLSHSPTSPTQPQNRRLTLINSTPAISNHNAVPLPTTTENATSTSTSAADPFPASPTSDSETSEMARDRASSASDGGAPSPGAPPSIRFSAYFDPRSTRPSLSFSPVSRTLPSGDERIRVGRYSERDGQTMVGGNSNLPSAAPVGFKSKVVSRRHCEFWCEDGKWFIKDVKSSSGTFLNHIRLSPPSQESRAFPVNDGDIVQLGIDFKGGEEQIFRCVKMRLELNRGWQNKLNSFNMAAHERLRNMATSAAANESAGSSSQDCSICLGSIAPCQSLFVAPCSHTWHFKCVRSLLVSPQYPIFICPNCRAGADLEADVDELAEEWKQLKNEKAAEAEANSETGAATSAHPAEASTPEPSEAADSDAMDVTVNITPETPQRLPHAVSEPMPISSPASGAGRSHLLRNNRTPSPPGLANGSEGPITPRNDAGPWVFDGSAGRRADANAATMTSLDAAAEMNNPQTPVSESNSR